MSLLTRNRNIHSPHTSNKMTRHENGSQEGNLTQPGINSQTKTQIGSAQLCQTVCLGPTDDLINVSESRQCRDEMVLHVTEVEEEISIRENGVLVG